MLNALVVAKGLCRVCYDAQRDRGRTPIEEVRAIELQRRRKRQAKRKAAARRKRERSARKAALRRWEWAVRYPISLQPERVWAGDGRQRVGKASTDPAVFRFLTVGGCPECGAPSVWHACSVCRVPIEPAPLPPSSPFNNILELALEPVVKRVPREVWGHRHRNGIPERCVTGIWEVHRAA